MPKSNLWVIAWLLIGVVVILSEGCYYDNAEDLYPTDTVFVQDTGGIISWNNRVKPIIDNNCATAGCHAANNSVRQPLTTHAEVKNAIENWSLQSRVESGSMPPAGSLSEADKAALLDWIDEGYPNN